jgi:hypothetical protein
MQACRMRDTFHGGMWKGFTVSRGAMLPGFPKYTPLILSCLPMKDSIYIVDQAQFHNIYVDGGSR